jgi:hypothetical protein
MPHVLQAGNASRTHASATRGWRRPGCSIVGQENPVADKTLSLTRWRITVMIIHGDSPNLQETSYWISFMLAKPAYRSWFQNSTASGCIEFFRPTRHISP